MSEDKQVKVNGSIEPRESGVDVPEQKQEITQELVDQTFIEMSEMWLDKFEESGHRLIASFVAENKDGFAVQFLAEYQMAKEHVESLGLTMPVLVEGITINLSEGEEDANQTTH